MRQGGRHNIDPSLIQRNGTCALRDPCIKEEQSKQSAKAKMPCIRCSGHMKALAECLFEVRRARKQPSIVKRKKMASMA